MFTLYDRAANNRLSWFVEPDPSGFTIVDVGPITPNSSCWVDIRWYEGDDVHWTPETLVEFHTPPIPAAGVVYIGGRACVPYICVGDKWKKAVMYVSNGNWTPSEWPDDLGTALEFVASDEFTIGVNATKWEGTMEYCNGDGWKVWDGSEITSGERNKGYCIYIRGFGNTVAAGGASYTWNISGTGVECNGNIENLLDYKTVKAGEHPSMSGYCYYAMFNNCASLAKAPDLPATTLAKYCYAYMFNGCENLTTAPILPATTLTNNCYDSMFQNCISLATVPNLPATTLSDSCYRYMFYGCISLTTAPNLPAATLKDSCYAYMFAGCISLTAAPSLPATTLMNSCYSRMFLNCTNLTTAPGLPATTLADSCYSGMFRNCTSLATAPSLPAAALANNCYHYMFIGCANLVAIPKLHATTLKDYCYDYMFYDCPKIKLSATRTGEYTREYRIPTSGTGTEATGCTDYMFGGTGGTFTGTPEINTTYYLHESNTIV